MASKKTKPIVTVDANVRWVLVTTAHRGVFYGRFVAEAETGEGFSTVDLAEARNVISFGTTKGFLQLAATGPTSSSKIGSRVPLLRLRRVTAVADAAPEAVVAWSQL